MKIGIDASRLTVGKRTGTENYSWQITRNLLNFSSSEFVLYFNQPPSPELLEKLGDAESKSTGLEIGIDRLKSGSQSKEFKVPSNVELRSIPFPRLWTHWRLSREMIQRPPDVLFVPAHVLPLLHPRRSVVTIHDLGYLYFPEAHTKNSRLYLDYSTRYSASQASHIIAVSHATRQDLIRHYGVNPDKISVVYHGFDHENFQPVQQTSLVQQIRQKYQIEPGPYILFVGTIQPRKNLIRLLEAFASISKDKEFTSAYTNLENLQLVIGGKLGWLSEPITRRIAELGLSKSVKLAGYVKDEDLPILLSGAEIFVMPSLYEGFGLPVLEAMACGTPVVCSNAGSLPEIVGEAALLHNPLDTQALAWNIRLLLSSPQLYAQLREKGLNQVKTFSWRKCAEQTMSVLEKH